MTSLTKTNSLFRVIKEKCVVKAERIKLTDVQTGRARQKKKERRKRRSRRRQNSLQT